MRRRMLAEQLDRVRRGETAVQEYRPFAGPPGS